MNRPTALLSLVAAATLSLAAVAAPQVGAATQKPAQAQFEFPTLDPCALHPFSPGCFDFPDLTVPPCIQYPEGCPTTTTAPPEPTTTTTVPAPTTTTPPTTTAPTTVPTTTGGSTSTETARPATAVSASPNFTG